MKTMSGKRLILFSMSIVTCGAILIFFATSDGSHLTVQGFQRLEARNRTGTLFNNTKTDSPPSGSQANETSVSHLKNEAHQPGITLTEPKKPCYRQIQHWVGSTKPQKPAVVTECPGLKCGFRYIEDSSFETMKTSDVVLHDFHRSKWDWSEMQKRRPLNQAWAFFTMEPTTYPQRDHSHLYNYTITHRHRPISTFYCPYGSYDNSTPQISRDDNRNWAQGRSKMVAWAASNCGATRWRRFDFVKKLSEHIQVDIYGGCGKRGCVRRSQSCWKLLRTYKFYLALENSECNDYITEKFWENSLEHDLLPIVYGPPREDYERVAPPHSFIHLQDFNSMKDLVDYLNLVASNDTLYNSYFEWKRQGSVRKRHRPGPTFACDIVSKVLDFEEGLPSGVSDEGANSEVYDLLPKLCDIAKGFPHEF